MGLWIVLHHHKHGVDAHLVEGEELDCDLVENGLIERSAFDPEEENEYWECKEIKPVPMAEFGGE